MNTKQNSLILADDLDNGSELIHSEYELKINFFFLRKCPNGPKISLWTFVMFCKRNFWILSTGPSKLSSLAPIDPRTRWFWKLFSKTGIFVFFRCFWVCFTQLGFLNQKKLNLLGCLYVNMKILKRLDWNTTDLNQMKQSRVLPLTRGTTS
jgi:hypothetical protein